MPAPIHQGTDEPESPAHRRALYLSGDTAQQGQTSSVHLIALDIGKEKAAVAQGVRRMSVESVEQVLQVLRGERPPNLVNPAVWENRR